MDIGQRQPLQERSCTTSAEELKAKHHFTTENCPWSNGTIESTCKQVMRAFRAVLSELKMYADEWPEVVDMVQSVLNISSSTRLNKMQVFTGHAETRDCTARADEEVQRACQRAHGLHQSAEAMEVEKLSKAITEIHA
jgi:hypothetical protein